tara:strand:- start:2661 stop:3305 length:645 start_codon:yes stop_codon:yes gene_type:complete
MSRKIIMIGGGGHAKVLADILKQQRIDIYAVSSPKIDHDFTLFEGLNFFLNDNEIYKFGPDEVYLVNGIGSIPGSTLREEFFQKFRKDQYDFLSIKSDFSLTSDYCDIGMGVQILPGAVINTDTKIGENCILNTGAIIEHDCILGASNHIAPGAMLSGGVSTGSSVHIGTGAVVIQGVSIGKNSIIGAGSVVTADVPANQIVYPSRSTQRTSPY